MYLIGGTPPYYTVTGRLESSLTHIKVNGRTHLPFSDRTELFSDRGEPKIPPLDFKSP